MRNNYVQNGGVFKTNDGSIYIRVMKVSPAYKYIAIDACNGDLKEISMFDIVEVLAKNIFELIPDLLP